METTFIRKNTVSPSVADSGLPAAPTKLGDVYREVRFRHSRHFAPILRELRSPKLVSTYAAGKVAAVGIAEGKLGLSFHNFEQAMGVAMDQSRPRFVSKRGWKRSSRLRSCRTPAACRESDPFRSRMGAATCGSYRVQVRFCKLGQARCWPSE